MPNSEPILRVEGLSKAFHDHALGRTLPAFEDLSFSLNPGEFLLLSGENGAGKSTLLRTIYRTYRPASGAIRYRAETGWVDLARAADVDVALLRRREIGFVTQFLLARPRVSAEDIVAEPLALADVETQHADHLSDARTLLTQLDVKPALWGAYPSTFSGGEQQKINLARALARPNRLLLLDEPTASLDVSARALLADLIADLKSRGLAMIGVFHHPGDIASLIDRELRLG
ncbi:MAG: ATP-binding cassette domain-containing protein [Pseudomonadota bacterium]